MAARPVVGSQVTAALNAAPFAAIQSMSKFADAPNHTASLPACASGSTFPARAALTALVTWMLFESWGIAGAILEQRDGGWLAAATAVVILLSALVSSVAGFAFSAIAGSALAYLEVEPVRAVQMMVVCSIATQFYAVWNIRESIRWRSVLPMIGAGAVTIPLGVWLLLHADALLYAAGLGAFLTAYGCYIAFRRESCGARGSRWYDATAGALGGLAGGLAGIPGAPVTIWCSMRGWDKLTQRAVYQPYILAMQVVTIMCLRWQAPEHLGITHDLSVVPFALLGAIGGLAIFRLMSNRQFQVAVSILLVISGLGLLGRVL
jgi:uncharacterized membrane protein YfcA